MQQLKNELRNAADPEKAEILQRFFKTGKGEYGEGDRFLGISVPRQRRIARQYSEISMKDLQKLLASKIHEERLVALLILIIKYKKAPKDRQEMIFHFYLKNTIHINNWDLVDVSAEHIVGDYLSGKDKSVLYRLAQSENLWERRIAIMSTFNFVKNHRFNDTLALAERLLSDRHDLIHKAAGWMLREIGKRDIRAEEQFLKKHYKYMPRTMLRYSIERFSERKRQFYLKR
jgi:3-methyladenine DNA glycosylase AlkD